CEIVDAAVFWYKKIIPVDSKFSLENYTRILETSNPMEKKKYEAALIGDIKNRIDETSKYVRPEEGTMDFAFMFIPSEALYYDLLINKVGAITENTRDLIAYAGEKRVYIVSATTFLAFLQTVLQGLRNQQISEKAKDIIKQVENLRRHLGNYETFLERLGKHMETTVNTYNIAYKEFGKIDKDVLKITGEAAGIEPLSIEGPSHESEEAE
ncbi:MAG: DNA recombination protein RmuC, partial [Patescibacteria group bacterium]